MASIVGIPELSLTAADGLKSMGLDSRAKLPVETTRPYLTFIKHLHFRYLLRNHSFSCDMNERLLWISLCWVSLSHPITNFFRKTHITLQSLVKIFFSLSNRWHSLLGPWSRYGGYECQRLKQDSLQTSYQAFLIHWSVSCKFVSCATREHF